MHPVSLQIVGQEPCRLFQMRFGDGQHENTTNPAVWLLPLHAGQTHLNFIGFNAEEAKEIGMIPTGIEHFAADTAFFGSFSFQEV